MKGVMLLSILFVGVLQTAYAQKSTNSKTKLLVSHALEQSPGALWYPLVRDFAQKNGLHCEIPQLPEPHKPKLKAWQDTIASFADQSPSRTILIGHSLGCVNLLHYLDSYKGAEKFPLLVLVAPTVFEVGYDYLKEFFSSPFQLSTLKNKVERIVVIITPTDPVLKPNPLNHGMLLVNEAGAKLIVLKTGNHFWEKDDNSELMQALSQELSAFTH